MAPYRIDLRVVEDRAWRAVNERALQAEARVRDLEETQGGLLDLIAWQARELRRKDRA